MAIESDRDVRTSSKGGWIRVLRNLVRLGFGSDDALVLENKTKIAWRVYHDYHMLVIIDPRERQTLKIEKRGTLNVRPVEDGEEIEYLVLSLDSRVHRISIYQRRMAANLEVYDMRAA
ncbi:MAG: hypothetical protein H0U76_27545 [Ktedonobacteraceae bacterium]|nr:hypothetical protein [Ktedonobacteraceae bacterium]